MAQVIAVAGVDPYALHDKLTSGHPDSIFDLARNFDDAGVEAADAYRRARQAHARVGSAFTNNGVAVLDVDDQNTQAWRGLGQGGEDMHETAAHLKRAGTALQSATAASGSALRRMEDDLEALRLAWNRFVAQPDVQVTTADEQQMTASAVQIVQTGGAAVQAQIDDYDGVLGHGTGALAALGYAAAPGPDDPGQPGGNKYAIGAPTRPPIQFDDDFVYDPNAESTLGDRLDWAKWGAISAAGKLRPDLDDAVPLYDHYRDGSGTPMTVDYEEAYREEPNVRRAVDDEIMSAQREVERIHSGSGQTAFSITGDATGVPYPKEENWQKTLGGHTVWGSGDVRIDGNRATMTLTVHAEDRYNFNRGAADVATDLPDNANGRFAELGWAKSFDVTGDVTRTVTWDLGSSAPPTVVDPGGVQRDRGGEDRVDRWGN